MVARPTVEPFDNILAECRNFQHVGWNGAKEVDRPANLFRLSHGPNGFADDSAEHHKVAAVRLHPRDLGTEVGGATFVACHSAGIDLHGRELLREAVEHVLTA
jgi:hypothetical protein